MSIAETSHHTAGTLFDRTARQSRLAHVILGFLMKAAATAATAAITILWVAFLTRGALWLVACL